MLNKDGKRKFSEVNKEGMVDGESAFDHFRGSKGVRLESLPFGENMRNTKAVLRELDRILKRHKVKYYLTSGLALGLVRDKSPIPWDDDIGLALDFESHEQKRNFIIDLLNNGYQNLLCNGYMPGKLNSKALTIEEYRAIAMSMLVSNTGMVEYSFLKNKVIVALFQITHLPDYNKVMIGKGKRIYPIGYYTDYDTVKYIGIEFKVPHPIEEYLEVCYGKDWRIPLDYKKRHIEDFQ